MLLYYITDRRAFGGTEPEQVAALLRRVADAAGAGVDYIQLREKDLSAGELDLLAHEVVRAVRENSSMSKLLINGRTDIALSCGADGVHLPSGERPASEVRPAWRKRCEREPIIGVSAHSSSDLRAAQAAGADFAVLAPIFEKIQTGSKGIGLDALREACAAIGERANGELPGSSGFAVLALGGVNLSNARTCVEAGAAGVAGIRLFQSGDVAMTVRQLREL